MTRHPHVRAALAVLACTLAASACLRLNRDGERGPPSADDHDDGPYPNDDSPGEWPPPARFDASVPDASSACEGELQRCLGSCVDVSSSSRHCGACGVTCFSPATCMDGICRVQCTAPKSACGTRCADLSQDERDCGECGRTCKSDEVCVDGECTCPEGQVACAGICTRAQAGACGVCGTDCPDETGCQDGASHVADWPTLAGDMSRTGYNAGERGQPPLTHAWSVSLIEDALNPVVISGARVYASGRTRFRGKGPLFALAAADGATLWTHDFGDVSGVGQPSVVDCRVYIQNSPGASQNPSQMWVLLADSGEVIWSKQVATQWSEFWAPTVTADAVYANGGTYGGLYGFARRNGALLFQNTDLAQFDQWVAASHDSAIFTFVEGKLRRHDARSGVVSDTISVSWDWAGYSMRSGPVFSPDGVAYVVAPPTLYAFEVATKKQLWSYAANVSVMPALAEGLVLALDSQLLSAFDAASGAFKWRCDQAEGLLYAPVAAHGFAYVSSKTTTYAVDLRDGRVAWQFSAGGWLSIGGGRLYVAGEDGILHSFVLTQPAP